MKVVHCKHCNAVIEHYVEGWLHERSNGPLCNYIDFDDVRRELDLPADAPVTRELVAERTAYTFAEPGTTLEIPDDQTPGQAATIAYELGYLVGSTSDVNFRDWKVSSEYRDARERWSQEHWGLFDEKAKEGFAAARGGGVSS